MKCLQNHTLRIGPLAGIVVIVVILAFSQDQLLAQEINSDLPICNKSQNFFVLNSSLSITQNFSSPNYPSDYPTYSYCIWMLTAPVGQLVKLTFSVFSIYAPGDSRQCPYAYIKVTEQYDMGKTQVVGRFCGSQSPQTIYSSGGSLRVEFKNTFRASAEGFVAKYSAIQPGTACSDRNSIDENSNILLHATSGRIVAPKFDNSFSNSVDCTWKIALPINNGVNMSFYSFTPSKQPLCSDSALEVYNGRFGHGHGVQLAVFCKILALPVIYSSGRYLSLRWRAKHPISAVDFVLDYISFPQQTNGACDEMAEPGSIARIEGLAGSLFSPGYPLEYPSNKECSWLLTVPQGLNVRLKFHAFQLEPSASCADFVEVRDGDSSSSPLKKRLCGASVPPVIISGFRFMYVKFQSNHVSSGKGFLAVFEATTEAPKVTTSPWIQPGVCSPSYTSSINNNLKLSGSSGLVLSPLYPSQYPNSISCTWKINAPNGKRIHLVFDDFWIDDQHGCHGDYLEVRDGTDQTGSQLGDKYCGNKKPGEIYSTGPNMWLQFVSDSSGTSHGFKARFSAISKPFNRFIAVGIAIGAIVIVLVLIFIYCKIKKKRNKGEEYEADGPENNHDNAETLEHETPGNSLLGNGTEIPHNNTTTANDYSVNYNSHPIPMETFYPDQENDKNNLSEEDFAWFKPSKRKSRGFEGV